MIKHTHTESAKINFSRLEERIMAINNPKIGTFNKIRKMLYELTIENKPILIIATGGSKVVAYYLQLIIERLSQVICEVIEPRDYFYKANIGCFSSLVAISSSGNTNGIREILTHFQGKKYLVCEQEKEADYEVIFWGNERYQKEKSFISLTTTLGPTALLLDIITSSNSGLTPSQIQKVNDKIKELLERSIQKIERLKINFQDTSYIQIMSGYETKVSSSVLESNLVEAGIAIPVVHDKGSYCHGRSNLLFRYPDSYVFYLSHGLKNLDHVLMASIREAYENLLLFDTHDLDDTIFWKEYYLMLQMYFLSKKIADDKNIDLTQPEYNPRMVKTLYNFKGEM